MDAYKTIPNSTVHIKYRKDIDGLRAIAVLSVVFYHAFPKIITGGFIGVDIFFVISGFLITSIIFDNLSENTFSISNFYAKRIKRIFPSLLITLTTTLILGWFLLTGEEYKQLGKHILSGSIFTSNITLWHEAGYFDNTAETKPLLHLWSLGIEEQFYIIWPALLLIAHKNKINLFLTGLLIATISFFLNIKESNIDLTADFYSPQTRFWELMAGSLLALSKLEKNSLIKKLTPSITLFKYQIYKDLISITSFLILIFCIVKLDSRINFPGAWALIPVLCTVICIASTSNSLINNYILSNKVLVFFGLISFPLYLWHWPLLSISRILTSDTPSYLTQTFTIIASAFLAWLTYKFVEAPIRFNKNIKSKTPILITLMTIIGFTGYNIYSRDGLKFRSIAKFSATGFDGGPKTNIVNSCGIKELSISEKFGDCKMDSRSQPTYALLGDSKAGVIFNGLVRTSTANGRWLIIGGNGPFGGPVPIISNLEIYKNFQPLTKIAVSTIAANKNIRYVLIANSTRAIFQLHGDEDISDLPQNKNYQAALDGLDTTVTTLIRSNKKIILLVDNPTLPHPEDCIERAKNIPLLSSIYKNKNPKCTLSLEKHYSLSFKYRKLLEEIQLRHKNEIKIFDTTKYFCDIKNKICTQEYNGRALYSFTDHMSDYAAGLIGKDLNRMLNSYSN